MLKDALDDPETLRDVVDDQVINALSLAWLDRVDVADAERDDVGDADIKTVAVDDTVEDEILDKLRTPEAVDEPLAQGVACAERV